MPQAVFHILAALIIADIIRDHWFHKKHFPLYLVLIAGIGGILPDIDVLVYWAVSLFAKADYTLFHRTFTHSLLFLALFLVPAIILWKHEKYHKIFLMLALGITVHLALDATFQGAIMPLFPFSAATVGLNLWGNAFAGTMAQGIDTILLVLWLIYIEWRHKVSDFI